MAKRRAELFFPHRTKASSRSEVHRHGPEMKGGGFCFVFLPTETNPCSQTEPARALGKGKGLYSEPSPGTQQGWDPWALRAGGSGQGWNPIPGRQRLVLGGLCLPCAGVQACGGEGEPAGGSRVLSLAAARAGGSEPWRGCSPGEGVWPLLPPHAVGNWR